MARVGADRWEVTAVAPEWLAGDLRPVPFEPNPYEANQTKAVPVYFSKRVHHLLYGMQTRRFIKSQLWDLVHSWQEPFVLSAAQLGWWTQPTPIVYYTYQNLSKWYPPPFNWCERWCLNRCSGWIAGGQTIYKALHARDGYNQRPSRIITLGVDSSSFQPNAAAREAIRQELGWGPGSPVVGYLGRFVPEKGVHFLKGVLDQLNTGWRALFVGGGALEAELRSWAAKNGDRIRIVTGVKHGQVPCYLNAMDILAAPSQTTPHWREQFGRMLVEGFSCGLPVISSDSGEIPYVVGDAGWVVPECDQAAWVSALSELLDSPSLRHEMSQRGRERVLQEFDWPVVARKHLTFFDEILDKTASRSEPT